MENKNLLEYLFISFVSIGLIFSFGYMHEVTHQTIYKYYGIESRIELFSGFPHMLTIAEKRCPPNTNCGLAHNINEIVGYHLMIIFVFMILAFLVIYITLGELKQ
tara:strand:- start:1109 stop:1423 length:315 start_codon:yes stop_codon:yes gene_type:complete